MTYFSIYTRAIFTREIISMIVCSHGPTIIRKQCSNRRKWLMSSVTLYESVTFLPNYERFPQNISVGIAYRQGTLTTADNWFRPIWDLQLRLVGRWARKPVNHTSWVAVVTPTDRPKSVRNRCLIELFVALFVLLCPFDISVGVGALS